MDANAKQRQMEQTDDFVSVKVPAGTYWIGDPCYCFTDDDWGKVLETCDTFDRPVGRAPNGETVLAFSTAHGDGEYRDNDGRRYGVDAGLIGLVPVGAATRAIEEVRRLCHKVTFGSLTLCTNAGGDMRFGRHLRIQTDDSEQR